MTDEQMDKLSELAINITKEVNDIGTNFNERFHAMENLCHLLLFQAVKTAKLTDEQKADFFIQFVYKQKCSYEKFGG